MKFYVAGKQNAASALRCIADYMDRWNENGEGFAGLNGPVSLAMTVDVQALDGYGGEWVGYYPSRLVTEDTIAKAPDEGDALAIELLKARLRSGVHDCEGDLASEENRIRQFTEELEACDSDGKQKDRESKLEKHEAEAGRLTVMKSVLEQAESGCTDEWLICRRDCGNDRYDVYGVCTVRMDDVLYGVYLNDHKLDVKAVPEVWEPEEREYLYLGRYDLEKNLPSCAI